MKKLFGVFLSMVLLLGIPTVSLANTTTQATSKITVERVYGDNRYDTAIAIADRMAVDLKNDGQFNNIVLASGTNWPDALAGGPLAAYLEAPILLLNTTPEGSKKTLSYVEQHLAKDKNIYILGGKGVVPQSFTDSLIQMGYKAENIHQIGGKDRQETSLLIAKMLPNPSRVYLVSSNNYYDATTISSYASQSNLPILLVNPNGLTQEQKEYCDSFNTVVTAGELCKTINQIYPKGAENMIEGENRYGTNAAGLRWDVRDETMYLTTGENWPDSLAGGALAGIEGGGGIILTKPNELPPETIEALNYIAYFGHSYERWPDPTRHVYPKLVVLGGPGAVSDEVVKQATEILNSQGYSW